MRTIAIINQKGGCGKTTTAINLAGMLAHRGRRVLLVDLDPQSHCAAGLGVPEKRLDLDIGDAMLAAGRGVEPSRLLWRVGKNLDLAPSRMKLAGLEAARGGLADKSDRDRRLAMVLQRLSGDYDAAIIDCSPSIGLLTFNALAAADVILIPVETSFFSLQGATKQYETIQSLSRRLHHNAETWLVPTIHVPDSSMARDLLEEVRRRFGDRVTPTVIRRDPILAEAATFGQPVVEHAPESMGAADYGALADWLVERIDRPDFASRLVEEAPLPLPGPGPSLAELIRGGAEETPPEAPLAPETPARTGRSLAEDIAVLAARMRKEPSRAAAIAEPSEGRAEAPAFEPSLAEFLSPRQTVVVAEEPRPAARPSASVKRLLGVRVTTQGALFVQPAALGQRVAIAGEFNNWSHESHLLRLNPDLGILEMCIALPPGVHRYQVVIDGRPCPDPYNPDFEPGPSGGFHSLARVGRQESVERVESSL